MELSNLDFDETHDRYSLSISPHGSTFPSIAVSGRGQFTNMTPEERTAHVQKDAVMLLEQAIFVMKHRMNK